MTDWAHEISEMSAAKRQVFESDREKLWRHEPPRPPASPETLATTSRRVGWNIDPEYASFLLHADGWPAFFQDVDLFGTEELIGVPAAEAKELISFFEDEVFAASGVQPGEIFPIAASRTDTDVFVMPTTNRQGLSPVIWFAGIEIERYSGFGEFFRAMRSYNLAQAEKLRAPDA